MNINDIYDLFFQKIFMVSTCCSLFWDCHSVDGCELLTWGGPDWFHHVPPIQGDADGGDRSQGAIAGDRWEPKCHLGDPTWALGPGRGQKYKCSYSITIIILRKNVYIYIYT